MWTPSSGVEKLDSTHDVGPFECGKPALDEWLKRYALTNQKTGTAVTYVTHRKRVVVGYYALAAGSVQREEAPQRVVKGLAKHPVPVVLLARLAVDHREAGQGLGAALLKDAFLRIEQAADIIGARAALVHAIDDDARRFYEHFEFEPSLIDEHTLMLLMKDLRAALRTK